MKRLLLAVPLRSAAPALAAVVLWIAGPGDEATGRFAHMAPRLILTALVVAAVAAGVGERALGWLRLRPSSRGQYVAYAMGLGLGLLSVAVMLLALCHVLSRHTIMALLIVLSIASPPREAAGAAWRGLVDASRRRHDSVGMGILLGLLVGMVLSAVAIGVCPPTDTDSLRYHLRLPELCLEAHTFQYPARNHFAHFPQAAEMLYAIGLSCAGSSGANIVGVVAGLACILAIYSVAADRFSPAVGTAAAAIFATTPLVGCLFGTAVVDLFVCLHVVLGVGAVLNHQASANPRWLLVAGLCGGMATAVKLGGGYAAVLIAAWAALAGGDGHQRALRRFAAVAVPAGLVVAPWIIKTTIVTGNPVFPLFPELFGGRDWRPEYTAKYVEEVRSYGRMGGGVLDYLLSPLWITVYWQEYGTPVPISPLYLLTLISLPLTGESARPVRQLATWCAGFLVLWLLTAQVARFVLPGLAAFAIVAGFVGVKSSRSCDGRPLAVPIHLALMVLPVAAYTWVMQWQHFEPWTYLSGRMTQGEYMAAHADYYPVVLHANRSLAEGSRILFVGETLAYNLHVPALVETGFSGVSAVEWTNQAASPSQLAQLVRERGFTHILFDKKSPEEYWAKKLQYFAWRDAKARRRFEDFLAEFATPLYTHRGVCLYELRVPFDGGGRQ